MINGKVLRQLRETKGMSSTELGEAVGVHQSMIINMEREFKRPSVELLARIAKFFGVTVDELIKKNS